MKAVPPGLQGDWHEPPIFSLKLVQSHVQKLASMPPTLVYTAFWIFGLFVQLIHPEFELYWPLEQNEGFKAPLEYLALK